jgi:hypothetical protein
MLDDDDLDEDNNNLNLKIAIMSFINAILCRGTCGEVFKTKTIEIKLLNILIFNL